jgi:hypothetical protein
MSQMRLGGKTPKYKVGDRVTVMDFATFGDNRCDFVLTITTASPDHGGKKLHRYYGTVERRGERGVYEDQIVGLADSVRPVVERMPR